MEPKPGWKTSEFWLTIVAMIVSVLLASGVWSADSVWTKILGGIGAVLASAGYSITRGKIKSATSPPVASSATPPKLPPT